MDPSSRKTRDEAATADQAVEWLERLQQQPPGDNAAFLEWLTESRAHVRELLLASAWDVTLRGVDPQREVDVRKLLAAASDNVVSVHQRTRSADRHPRWVSIRVAAAAAALVLLAFLVAWRFWDTPDKYATAVGEQRTLELADGSVVSLSAQTTVNVELSKAARDLYLKDGQAIFAVAHDAARPFRVHAGSVVVQAIGTKFDVRRIGVDTHVTVIEGKVLVIPERNLAEASASSVGVSKNTELAAGQAVSITSRGITAPTPAEIADVTVWQQRRLKFRYSTLEEVVHEFNRFNQRPRIRIEGDRLRLHPISGVFDADDPESLIASLTSAGDIAVERSGDGVIIRARQGAGSIDVTD